MDIRLREAQLKALNAFSKEAKDFALCGGTALELFYLKHRFSVDLDFFSKLYDKREIGDIISGLKTTFKRDVKLENKLVLPDRAQVRFSTIFVRGSKRPLKIDFVQENQIIDPKIKVLKGIRVYSPETIYLQKIFTLAGTRPELDEIGRQISIGRRAAKDVYDIYMLSKKIEPLHKFLKTIGPQLQRGIVHWYRTFSRQELKLALLDLDIYDKKFNSSKMIIYLENEIKMFMNEVML